MVNNTGEWFVILGIENNTCSRELFLELLYALIDFFHLICESCELTYNPSFLTIIKCVILHSAGSLICLEENEEYFNARRITVGERFKSSTS